METIHRILNEMYLKINDIHLALSAHITVFSIIIQDIQELKLVIKGLTNEISNDPINNWEFLVGKPYIYAKYTILYHLPSADLHKISSSEDHQIPSANIIDNQNQIILCVDEFDIVTQPPIFFNNDPSWV